MATKRYLPDNICHASVPIMLKHLGEALKATAIKRGWVVPTEGPKGPDWRLSEPTWMMTSPPVSLPRVIHGPPVGTCRLITENGDQYKVPCARMYQANFPNNFQMTDVTQTNAADLAQDSLRKVYTMAQYCANTVIDDDTHKMLTKLDTATTDDQLLVVSKSLCITVKESPGLERLSFAGVKHFRNHLCQVYFHNRNTANLIKPKNQHCLGPLAAAGVVRVTCTCYEFAKTGLCAHATYAMYLEEDPRINLSPPTRGRGPEKPVVFDKKEDRRLPPRVPRVGNVPKQSAWLTMRTIREKAEKKRAAAEIVKKRKALLVHDLFNSPKKRHKAIEDPVLIRLKLLKEIAVNSLALFQFLGVFFYNVMFPNRYFFYIQEPTLSHKILRRKASTGEHRCEELERNYIRGPQVSSTK